MPKADNTANEEKKRAEDLAKEANAFAVKMLKSIQDFQIDVANLAAEKKAKINFIDPDQLQSAVALTDMFQKEIFGNLQKVNKHLVDFNQQASDIINSSLVETFAGIGTAIGESLANGTSLAQNLGASLLNSLGSVLGQLGQMAIAAGLGIKAIKIALETLNPFVAIAAGVALLALSGVVKGQASKIGKSMGGGGGGGSSGGGSVPIPQGSATISTSAAGSAQDFGGGRVVFEISGTNLIGVLNRAGAKLQRFGP
jgi:hypothetical protein